MRQTHVAGVRSEPGPRDVDIHRAEGAGQLPLACPIPVAVAAAPLVARPPQRGRQFLLDHLFYEAPDPVSQPGLDRVEEVSPANSGAVSVLVLFLSMAWSPPALERRS